MLTFGELFPIAEDNLIEYLKRKIQTTDIKKHQQIILEKTERNIRNPKPVEGLKQTTVKRTFYYDPSISLAKDLADDKGRVFYKKGTMVNPLKIMKLSQNLLFIDGTSEAQIAWAKTQKGKLILINGNPFDLMQDLNRKVYFDQAGLLTKKLGLEYIPARVSQEELRLKIEEEIP